MSDYRAIDTLSREELLNLIYNNFGGTTKVNHPCLCASCGDHPTGKKTLTFCCDSCNLALEAISDDEDDD